MLYCDETVNETLAYCSLEIRFLGIFYRYFTIIRRGFIILVHNINVMNERLRITPQGLHREPHVH